MATPAPPPAPPERGPSSSNPATRKVGPFPVWVWVVGVGAVAIWYYRRSQSQSQSPASLPGVTGTTSDTGGGLLPDVSGVTSPPTLEDWAQRAEAALVKAGVSPANASGAVYDYINGNQLSSTERNIIDRALRLIGFPPTLLPIPVIAPPHPTPKPVTHGGAPPPLGPIHGSPRITPKELAASKGAVAQLASRYGITPPSGSRLEALVLRIFPTYRTANAQTQALERNTAQLQFITNEANLKSPTNAQVLAGAQYLSMLGGHRWSDLGPAQQRAAQQQSRVMLLEQLNPVRAR